MVWTLALQHVNDCQTQTPDVQLVTRCRNPLPFHDVQEFIPVAFSILVERLKASLLAEDAGITERTGRENGAQMLYGAG
jgi:hypothetical protein